MPGAPGRRPQRPRLRLGLRALTALAVARRALDRTLRDGFIHAGNLAFLALLTLFPAALLVHAAAASFGRTDAGQRLVGQVLAALPGEVADVLGPVIGDVLGARSGTALLAGALVALWTTSGFIATLRDLLRRAHGVRAPHPFWRERLLAIALTGAVMLLVLLGFLVHLLLELALSVTLRLVPAAERAPAWVDLSRTAAVAVLFLSLWALIALLSPRRASAPNWPGAAVITLVWVGATALVGPVLSAATGFSLTYGALAGVVATLLFFQAVGLGMVLGAEVNAALAKRREISERVARRLPRADQAADAEPRGPAKRLRPRLHPQAQGGRGSG